MTAASMMPVRKTQVPGWATAFLLMACFVMAQADKQVVGLLAVPIQNSLGISNTELGFLQGGAFALAFAIGGLPIAIAIDRGRRIAIAATCVACWSIATIMCGLATGFAMLLLFRALTAFAEAGLPPAAFSIFSQSARPQVMAKLTGTFMLAPFVGGGGILLLGGYLLGVADGPAQTMLNGFEGWRLVFIAIGAPGIALAMLLWLFGREPERSSASRQSASHARYKDVAVWIFGNSRFLRYYYSGMASFYLLTAALLAWFPAFLMRTFDLSAAAVGGRVGIVYLAAGMAGTLAVIVRAGTARSLGVRGFVRGYIVVMAIILPCSIAMTLAPGPHVAVALYGIYAFLTATIMASMSIPLQIVLPIHIQARGVAIFSLVMSALAGSIGPLAVGVLLDTMNVGIGEALAMLALPSGAIALVMFALALRALAREAH